MTIKKGRKGESKQKMKQEEKQGTERLGIENKARFWFGVALIVPELVILIVYAFGFVDWSFINMISLGVAAILLYNVLAGILIWTGSRTKKKE